MHMPCGSDIDADSPAPPRALTLNAFRYTCENQTDNGGP